jgi:hypothetical protein
MRYNQLNQKGFENEKQELCWASYFKDKNSFQIYKSSVLQITPRPDGNRKLCELKHTAITLKKRLKEALFGG